MRKLRPGIEEKIESSMRKMQDESYHRSEGSISEMTKRIHIAEAELHLIGEVTLKNYFVATHFLPPEKNNDPESVFNYVRQGMEGMVSLGNNDIVEYLVRTARELPAFQLRWLKIDKSVEKKRGELQVPVHHVMITHKGLDVYRELLNVWDAYGKKPEDDSRLITALSRLPNGFLGKL